MLDHIISASYYFFFNYTDLSALVLKLLGK